MIALITVGDADETVVEALKPPLAEAFGQPVETGRKVGLPPQSWHRERRQYLAPAILDSLPPPRRPSDRALGIADVDLFAPGLNFVFGVADLNGGRALVSLCRLRQEFYRVPADDRLFRERTLKEAVHELGHTYGLNHCPDRLCVMHFSNSLRDTDLKGWRFCPKCQARLGREAREDASDG